MVSAYIVLSKMTGEKIKMISEIKLFIGGCTCIILLTIGSYMLLYDNTKYNPNTLVIINANGLLILIMALVYFTYKLCTMVPE